MPTIDAATFKQVDVSKGQVLAQATSKTFKKKGQVWYVFNVNARAVGDRKEEVLNLAAASIEEAKEWLTLMGNSNTKNQSLFKKKSGAAEEEEESDEDESDDEAVPLFEKSELVVINKLNSHVKGAVARVVDPSWNGLVKIELTTSEDKGQTKSYNSTDLIKLTEAPPGLVKTYPEEKAAAEEAPTPPAKVGRPSRRIEVGVMEDEAEVLWKGWMRAPNGPAVQGQSSDEREMSKVACYSVITGGGDNSPPKLTLLKGADSLQALDNEEVTHLINENLVTPTQRMADEIGRAEEQAGDQSHITIDLATIIYLNIVDTKGKVRQTVTDSSQYKYPNG
mmetsp:Transcript_86775/g.245713  ORF Transcript_86775/g.245713 Transcript_86775/m.245713 type:complete len:336 (+) Transcript_86775:824-1831(+)